MNIHIVQPGDTIYTLADQYSVSATRLALDNNLVNSETLVTGQAIVILYPTQTYIVQPNDTLEKIANSFKIPLMQLFRNNNYLFERKNIYPFETLVISYNNEKGPINTFGYANTYIDINTLNRTLPYLTYLCVRGNRITDNAEIISIDDEKLIEISKEYGVAPIMLLSSLTIEGLNTVDFTYNVFNSERLSEKLINNIISILKSKGYYGVSITFQYLISYNLSFYINYIKKLSTRLKAEGLKFFVTLSPRNTSLTLEDIRKIDSNIENIIDGITFTDYNKSTNTNPTLGPVTSVENLEEFLTVACTIIDGDIINIGSPVIGLDWELPYIPNVSSLFILKYDTAIELAKDKNSIINFDESSKTPYFNYTDSSSDLPIQHIVWFVDARTISSIVDLIPKFDLSGTGIWNIMYYFSQIWLIINPQYKITKIFPEP